MSEPRVSVVLPVYNRAELLRVSAGSVLAQSFADLELIIVDDGSSDDVEEVVRSLGDERVRYVRREKNGGVSAARNTGISLARGHYIAFQDSDDEWLLDKLQTQLDVLGTDECLLVGGVIRRSREGALLQSLVPPDSPARYLSFEQTVWNRNSYTQSWVLPRYMLNRVGGFDERFRIWEDYELLIRLAGNFRVKAFPAPLVVSHKRSDGLTADGELFRISLGMLMEKHGERLAESPALWGRLNHSLGRMLIAGGEFGAGRRHLRCAVQCSPGEFGYWKSFAASFLRSKRLSNYFYKRSAMNSLHEI